MVVVAVAEVPAPVVLRHKAAAQVQPSRAVQGRAILAAAGAVLTQPPEHLLVVAG